MEIKELITRLREVSEHLFVEGYNIFADIMKLMPEIEQNYMEYVRLIPALNNIGMNIDMDQVVFELKSITPILSEGDKVALSDLLYYEMPDTLSAYDEIKKIMAE